MQKTAKRRAIQTVIEYHCDEKNCSGEMVRSQVAPDPHGRIRHRCTVCHTEEWLDREYPFVETTIAA